MALTLYYHILSQPARAVLALLHLGNIKFNGKVVNLFNGETRTAEYLKINPFGGVPFIVHNGLHLSESNAILTHLCQSFSGELNQYYGENANERAIINQYLSWYQGTFRPVLLRPLRMKLVAWKTNQPYSLKQLRQSEKKVNQTFYFLENRLVENSPYLVGDHLSIADLLLYQQTTNIDYFGVNLSKWSKLDRWYKTVHSNKVVNDIHADFVKESQGMKKIFSNLNHIE